MSTCRADAVHPTHCGADVVSMPAWWSVWLRQVQWSSCWVRGIEVRGERVRGIEGIGVRGVEVRV